MYEIIYAYIFIPGETSIKLAVYMQFSSEQ